MDLSARTHLPAPPGPSEQELEVAWHDLECGCYDADLELWRELAEANPGPILEIGAGTGRVALDLSRTGHAVTALDRDAVLLAALSERASGAGVRPVLADARRFHLAGPRFSLCIVPMQTVQLLGGSSGRAGFLRAARAHLRSGGLLACAILAAVGSFDCAAGDVGPAPERSALGERLLVSRPVRVHTGRSTVLIERLREVLPGPALAARGERALRERSVIELDRLSAGQLRREALAAELRPAGTRQIPATEDHVGSTVVMLRA